MARVVRHLSVALFVVTMLGSPAPATAQTTDPPNPTGPATFVVMLRGARVGSEMVSLSRVGSDWLLSGTGHLGTPFDVGTTKFEMRYGADWQPAKLQVEASIRGTSRALATTFGVTTALNEITQSTGRTSNSQQISSRSVVLPSLYFAAYEALAARVGASAVGTTLPVYVPPDGGTSVRIERVEPRHISLGDRSLDLRAFTLSLSGTSSSANIDVWVDERNRLARLEMPAVSVVVIRDDLASVMAREERVRNPRDENAFIPANGFSLGATVTAASEAGATAGRRGVPAIVFVSGAGPQDRDQTIYGVPVAGQLAGALSDAGYFVVRYDGRGVGRSGGRTENATLADYADDVVRVVNWVRRQDGVDDNRIAVVAYGDAGPVALMAAAREGRIKAVALLSTPGKNGQDVALEQQAQALERAGVPEIERSSRIELQRRVIEATLSGKGWEALPSDLRLQADTPWFKSWLEFQPAATIRRLKQPLLILRGALDREMPPAHADGLATLSAGRKNIAPAFTQKVVVPGVNHLLVPATTGTVDEYATLPALTVAPVVGTTVAEWLDSRLPAQR